MTHELADTHLLQKAYSEYENNVLKVAKYERDYTIVANINIFGTEVTCTL